MDRYVQHPDDMEEDQDQFLSDEEIEEAEVDADFDGEYEAISASENERFYG